MDFSFSPEQETFRENVRRYCRDELREKSLSANNPASHRRYWLAFANLDWLGVLLPQEVGGVNGSIIDASIILEEFGRNLITEPYLPCAVLAARIMNRTFDADRRSTLLASMVRGELIVSLAHTEPAARGDIGFVETTALQRSSGEYVLHGHKTLVLGGPIADQFAVSARVARGGRDQGGVAVFMVDREAQGMTRRDYCTMDGRGATDLRFKGVKVGEDALLIPEERGLLAIEEATDYAIVCLCAEAIGAMDTVIRVTTEYLKTRRAYGVTLNTFQALQHRLVDMFVELEMSRSMLYGTFAAFSEASEGVRRTAVSSAKAFIGRSAQFVAAHGVQLHGAQGMVDEYLMGRHFKQLTVIEALFGTSDFHWEQCALRLGGASLSPHASARISNDEGHPVWTGVGGGQTSI
jgi:alkylation response protein AidB-like acyl-CoA dehydrogenase